ncbi:MAG: CNNM domain-containing protein [Rikenellaceae bacterium]
MYILLIVYFFSAILISFICSVVEAVILSVTLSFIETKEREEPGSTKLIRKLKSNIDKPISAILALNTVAHTIGAAGVGAEATRIWGSEIFGVVSVLMTLAILIFSEILPKTIGAIYWKSIALLSAKIINVMIVIAYPLVYMSEVMTKLVFKRKQESVTSREEISVLADIGTQEGVLQKKENDIIQNIISLRDTSVDDVMTPRTVLVAAQEDMLLKDFIYEERFKAFTRIPIYKDNIDEINGYILRPYVFECLLSGKENLSLKDIRREFIVAYNNMSLSNIWEELLLKNEHIALVIDQYGGVDGIVTMEDIIESLIGREIVDERDTNSDMQQVAREKWEKRELEINRE